MRHDEPSNTALIVAAGLQLLRPPPALAHLMPDEAIRLGAALLRAAQPIMASLIWQPWFAATSRVLERATLPGITLHFALRKRRLRDHAHAAVANGCTQVVLLGAGLDTLCMELKAQYPELCCIEIDHPATQRSKRAAAGGGGDIHYLGVDLAQQPLASALDDCPAYRRGEPTLFVAEGLLMYVPFDAVASLFEQMAAVAPRSWVAFTWLETQADGRPNFRRRSQLVDAWLSLRGEPFMSGLPRDELAQFLSHNGFELREVCESADLLGPAERAALGPDRLPIPGEYICLAQRAVTA